MNRSTDREKMQALIADYLAGSLSADQERELADSLKRDPFWQKELADLFRTEALIRQAASHDVPDTQTLLRQIEARTRHDDQLLEKVIVRASARRPESSGVLVKLFGSRRSFYAFAASMILSATVIFSLLAYMQSLWNAPRETVVRSQPAIARLAEALAVQWQMDGKAPQIGQTLTAGLLKLDRGMARIEFDGGASLILQGPAELELRTAASAKLTHGRASVRAEGSARGFRLEGPHCRITDLGTAFALDIQTADQVEVHVFEGLVEAALLDADGEATQARRLEADRALRLNLRDRTLMETPVDTTRFVQQRSKRIELALPMTGQAALGSADPVWRLASIMRDPSLRPGPAHVLRSLPGPYLPNDERSRWISVVADPDARPAKASFMFEAGFDLPENLVPGTARIQGRYVVDDQVLQIRVNGTVIPIPPRGSVDMAQKHRAWTDFQISNGLRPGRNTIEVEIYNEEASQLGLRMELTGEAQQRLPLASIATGVKP